jgi:hypothetical protein
MSGFFTAKMRFPLLMAVFLTGIVFLSGCQQNAAVGRFVSDQGVSIEALLPADLLMLGKIGSRDLEQLENLRQLNSYFPNDPMGMLIEEFNQGVSEGAGLQELGLDYQRDLLPLLKENSELYLALAPALEKEPASIRLIMVLTIADKAALDRLLATQLQRGAISKKTHLGMDYYVTGDEDAGTGDRSAGGDGTVDSADRAFLARIADVFVIANDELLLKEAIASGVEKTLEGSSLLVNNPVYRRALEDYRPSLFFLYGDFRLLLDFLNRAEIDGQPLAPELESLNWQTSGLEAIAAETISLRAEKEGLRMMIRVWAGDGQDLREQAGKIEKSYLFEKLPAVAPFFYSEGYNFGQSYQQFMELAVQDDELRQGMDEMEQALAGLGLDFQRDILTFLDRGYAFVLEDNDSVFPALGFYLDTTGNVAGAEKVFALLNGAVEELWTDVKAENPELTMLLKHEELDPGRLWRFTLNPDLLLSGQDPALVKKLSGQKIEFYYGILSDQTAVLALKPGLPESFARPPRVADSEEFRRALKYLNGAENGITYLAPAQMFVYFDRLVELAKTGGLPEAQLAEYETVKSYLRPLKSIVFGSHGVEKDQTSVEIFLHIAK